MSQVVFTCTTASNNGFEADNYTKNGNIGTWSNSVGANVISLKASGAQTRISKIEITVLGGTTLTFTPPAGTYTEAQNVTIACATEGATLEYSKDGENWLPYSEAIPVTKSVTLYAKATKDGESATASADYVIKQAVKVSSIADMYEKIAKPASGASSEEFVVDFESVVIASGAGNNYIYDGEKYSLIYKSGMNLASTTKVAKGWTATLKNYNGLYEIEPAVELTTLEGGVLPEPTVVTAEAINADNQALYALLKNVTVSDATPETAKAYTVTVDGQTINCFNRFGVASQPEGLYDVVCIISVNNNSPQILPISFSKVEVPVTLGEIVVTYGEDNTPVENDAKLIGDKAVVVGTVFNFSAENATSIVVVDVDDNVIAQGESSTTWTPTVAGSELLTVTATREGEDPKTLSFMVEVVAAPAPQLGDIVVTYGDGNVVSDDFDVLTTVEAGTVFSATAENATHIKVETWYGENVFEADGPQISWTMTEPIEEEGVTVTATLGEESPEFMFRIKVVAPKDEIWTLVKTVDELIVGGRYIITNDEAVSAMSSENNANFRKITSVTVSEDILKNPSADVLQLEIEMDGEDYMWRTVNYRDTNNEIAARQGYLNVASGNSNYLNATYPTETNLSRRNTSVSFDGNNVLITFVNADFKTGPEKRRIFFNNDRFATYSETNSEMGKIKVFKLEMPEVPMFDEKVGEMSVSFTSTKGELHAWVIEYDAEDNVVKENEVEVTETPASVMAKAPAADDTTWTNKVAEENEEFIIAAPETEGNYKMIRAKAVHNGAHSAEVVRGITYEGGVLSGVEAVVAEDADAAVEYFNLQGVRVNAEQPGLYIRRQGDKVSKVVIR